MKRLLNIFCIGALICALGMACDDTEPKQTDNLPGKQGGNRTEEPEGEKRFYYAYDEKIYLDEIPDMISIELDVEYSSELEQYFQADERFLEIASKGKGILVLKMENPDVEALREELAMQEGVKAVNPVYKLRDNDGGGIMYMTDEFSVKWKDDVSQQQIEEMHEKYGVKVVDDPYQYLFEDTHQLLSVPADIDVLDVANAYQESGLVIYSHPNFRAKIITGF